MTEKKITLKGKDRVREENKSSLETVHNIKKKEPDPRNRNHVKKKKKRKMVSKTWIRLEMKNEF